VRRRPVQQLTNMTVQDSVATPEPSSLSLLGAGLIGMFVRRRVFDYFHH